MVTISNWTIALGQDDIVIPTISFAALLGLLNSIALVVLLVLRLRGSFLTKTRPVAPFIFHIFIMYNAIWAIVDGALQLSQPVSRRNSQNQFFVNIRFVMDSLDVLFGFPCMFLAGIAYIMQTLQFGVVKRTLETAKIRWHLQAVSSASAAAASAQSPQLKSTIRVLKVLASPAVIIPPVIVAGTVYWALGIVLSILGYTSVVPFETSSTIMSIIAYAVALIMIVFMIILSIVELMVSLMRYFQGAFCLRSEMEDDDRSKSPSFSRFLLDYIFDRPHFNHLERILAIPLLVCMIYVAVTYICFETCASTKVYRAALMGSNFIILFGPGGFGSIVLFFSHWLLSLCMTVLRPRIRKMRKSRRRDETGEGGGSSSSGSSGKHVTSFEDHLLTLLDKKGREYHEFMSFAAKEFSTENIMCLQDLLHLRKAFISGTAMEEQIVQEWCQLVKNYCFKNAPLEINISSSVRKVLLESIVEPGLSQELKRSQSFWKGNKVEPSPAPAPEAQTSIFERIPLALDVLQRAAMGNCFDTYGRFKPNHAFQAVTAVRQKFLVQRHKASHCTLADFDLSRQLQNGRTDMLSASCWIDFRQMQLGGPPLVHSVHPVPCRSLSMSDLCFRPKYCISRIYYLT